MLKANAVHSTERTLAPTFLPPEAAEEHAREVARLRSLRRELEATINDMIGLLDQLDGDPDLEDDDALEETDPLEDGGDDEHDLGWAANASQVALGRATDDGDNTAPERFGYGFVRCAADDLEDGHDAEEVNEDGGNVEDEGEPTLGWTNNIDQTSLGCSPFQDGELEPSLCGLTVSTAIFQGGEFTGSDLEATGTADDASGTLLSWQERQAAIQAGQDARRRLLELLQRRRQPRGGLIGSTVLAPDGSEVRVIGYVNGWRP